MSRVFTPPTSTAAGSASSCAPVARQKRSPIRKSRLPCMRKTGTPARTRPAKNPAITALNGSPKSSSPIQYSKRSPRTYSAAAWLAVSSTKPMNLSLASGRSSLRCRSETKRLLATDHAGRFDDDGRARHVLMHALVGGGHGDDLVDDVHAAHHLGEHGIAVAVLPGVIEEVVVVDVDEELRGRRVGVARPCHGDRAGLVLQAVLRFDRHRRARRLLRHARRHAAALDHEARDHAVKDGAVV